MFFSFVWPRPPKLLKPRWRTRLRLTLRHWLTNNRLHWLILQQPSRRPTKLIRPLRLRRHPLSVKALILDLMAATVEALAVAQLVK